MNKIVKSLIVFGVGCLIAFAAASYRGLFQAESVTIVMKVLSDGFFVSAVLYMGIGLLVMISSTGFFDMTKYGLQILTDMFRKVPERKDKNFFEYVVRMRQERSEKDSMISLLLVGIVYLILATIFMILFYKI